jgi:hypothetical protein
MIRRSMLHLVLGTALVAAPAPWARAEGGALVKAVVGSGAEAKGDFDRWLGELVRSVASDPESPFAAAALLKISALAPSATDPTVVEAGLAPLLQRGVRDGDTDERLHDVLADRARARGDDQKAQSYGGDRGYVRRFAVAGSSAGTTPCSCTARTRRSGPTST